MQRFVQEMALQDPITGLQVRTVKVNVMLSLFTPIYLSASNHQTVDSKLISFILSTYYLETEIILWFTQ